MLSRFSDQLISAADHMTSYLDQLDKEVVGTTYKNLYQLIDKINTCGYFEQGDVATEPEQTISEVVYASTSSEISPQKRKCKINSAIFFHSSLSFHAIYIELTGLVSIEMW